MLKMWADPRGYVRGDGRLGRARDGGMTNRGIGKRLRWSVGTAAVKRGLLS